MCPHIRPWRNVCFNLQDCKYSTKLNKVQLSSEASGCTWVKERVLNSSLHISRINLNCHCHHNYHRKHNLRRSYKNSRGVADLDQTNSQLHKCSNVPQCHWLTTTNSGQGIRIGFAHSHKYKRERRRRWRKQNSHREQNKK